MGDSDSTYDFLELPSLIAPIQSGKADLVIGSRFKGVIHPRAMTALHRYIGNPLLTWLLNTIFSTRFSDAHSGFRAFRREIIPLLRLQSTGMEFASEMLIKAAKAGVRIEEVPIQYYPRNSLQNSTVSQMAGDISGSSPDETDTFPRGPRACILTTGTGADAALLDQG